MNLTTLQLNRDPAYPPSSGGEIRAWKTAQKFTDYGTVYVGHPCDQSQQIADRLYRIDTNNPFLDYKFSRIYLWNALLALDSQNLIERLQTRRTVAALSKQGHEFDIVLCEFPQVLGAAEKMASRSDAKLLLNKHNVMFDLLSQQLSGLPIPDYLKRRAVTNLRKLEQDGIEQADAVVFQSPTDREAFDIPKTTLAKVIPNGTNFEEIHEGGDPESVARSLGLRHDAPTCVFLGAYDYEPNRLAAKAIVEDIAPHLPELNFLLVGRNPPRAERENVYTPGFVDDLAGLLSLADIALCPLTQGSGTKLKMMDYLSAGLPIVTTSVGTQGIPITDGETALVRDSTDGMVAAIRTLCESPDLLQRLSANAADLGRQYAWDTLLEQYDELVCEWF